MGYTRLASFMLCLAVALAGCAAPSAAKVATPYPIEPAQLDAVSAEELAAAEAKLANFGYSHTNMVMPSVEELVGHVDVVAVGKVTKVGPIFNGSWKGNSAQSGSSEDFPAVTQVYEVQVERYLKGSVPTTLLTAQNEGYLPAQTPYTAANVKAAKSKYEHAPMVVGRRYVFFWHGSYKVSELGDAEVYAPGSYLPKRILLKENGQMETEDDDPAIDDRLGGKGTPENALIQRLEKAIADTKK